MIFLFRVEHGDPYRFASRRSEFEVIDYHPASAEVYSASRRCAINVVVTRHRIARVIYSQLSEHGSIILTRSGQIKTRIVEQIVESVRQNEKTREGTGKRREPCTYEGYW